MYLIKHLPDHVLVFDYGERLTQKRKDQCAEILLNFVKENYDIEPEMLTLKRSYNTLEQFTRYKEFKRTETGYQTENSGTVNSKPIKIITL